MNKSSDYYLTSLLIILSLIVGVFTVHTSSILSTGIGFGKDTRFIVYSENERLLDEFLMSESKNLKEVQKTNISDFTYLLSFSGIEQIEDYKDKLESIDPELKVVVMGSFGSVTKLKNNESFIATYFLVFFILLLIYFSNRFGTIGYLSALELISLLMSSLYINQIMGYPYTKMLWYGVLFSIVILIYHEEDFLQKFKGQSLDNLLAQDKNKKRRYAYVQISLAFIFLFIAIVSFNLESFSFYSLAVYMLALSLMILLRLLLQSFFILPLFVYCAKKDGKEEQLVFSDKKMFFNYENKESAYKILNIILISFLSISLLIGFTKGWTSKESEDYTNQNVMIINRSDANTYLQVQAILHREGMYNKQRSYEVSEQENLWIKFSDKISFSELESISKIVGEEMKVSVTYYNTSSALNPLETFTYYQNYILYLIAAMLILYLFDFSNKALFLGVLSILSSAFFILLLTAFQIEWTREIVFISWAIPFIITSELLLMHKGLSYKYRKENHLRIAFINLVILIIMAIPVFVIVPTTIAVEMVFILALMLLSSHYAFSTFNLLHAFLRKVVIENDK